MLLKCLSGNFISAYGVIRQLVCQHKVKNNTYRINIRTIVIYFSFVYFRCYEVWSSQNEIWRCLRQLFFETRKSKVYNFYPYVVLFIINNNNIFWLHISVNNSILVYSLESHENLSCNLLSRFLFQRTFFLHIDSKIISI